MPPTGFLLAMRPVCRAPDESGEAWANGSPLWLIVSRFGHAGRFATLSLTRPQGGVGGEACAHVVPSGLISSGPAGLAALDFAPLGLMPAATLFGEYCRESTRGCDFAFVSELPPGMQVAGRFLPARGVMRVAERAGRMVLEAETHLIAGASGMDPDHADPRPPCRGKHWRISAEYRPWVGEFIEPLRAPAA